MIAITVDLLHGKIRAGSADSPAWAGRASRGEWPPSPARVFAALVSADGTRGRSRVTDGTELRWLEGQTPPLIYASPESKVSATSRPLRYVVLNATVEGSVQNYPGRRSKPYRPGVVQSPESLVISYVWPDAVAKAEHLKSLRLRAARVGYLGCADSPVRLRVFDSMELPVTEAWVPDANASNVLPVTYSGFLDELDAHYDLWVSEGAERSWLPTIRSGYRSPSLFSPVAQPEPALLWLRFSRPLLGKRLVQLTTTLRSAVMDRMQRVSPDGSSVPAIIHGHRGQGDGPDQACFAGLPNVASKFSDGRMYGAVIVVPQSASPDLPASVFAAVAGLRQLVKPGCFDIGVTLHRGEKDPLTANPARWTRPSRRWVSATPVVHERWSKRGAPGLDEVSRWCRHAGVPDPVSASFSRQPLLTGALDLHPTDVFREGHERRPYSHLEIEFSTPVKGPLILGRGRHTGLGLMAPMEKQSR